MDIIDSLGYILFDRRIDKSIFILKRLFQLCLMMLLLTIIWEMHIGSQVESKKQIRSERVLIIDPNFKIKKNFRKIGARIRQ